MITAIAETIVKLEEVDSLLMTLCRETGDERWSNWSDRVDRLCEALTSELSKREHEAWDKLNIPADIIEDGAAVIAADSDTLEGNT